MRRERKRGFFRSASLVACWMRFSHAVKHIIEWKHVCRLLLILSAHEIFIEPQRPCLLFVVHHQFLFAHTHAEYISPDFKFVVFPLRKKDFILFIAVGLRVSPSNPSCGSLVCEACLLISFCLCNQIIQLSALEKRTRWFYSDQANDLFVLQQCLFSQGKANGSSKKKGEITFDIVLEFFSGKQQSKRYVYDIDERSENTHTCIQTDYCSKINFSRRHTRRRERKKRGHFQLVFFFFFFFLTHRRVDVTENIQFN